MNSHRFDWPSSPSRSPRPWRDIAVFLLCVCLFGCSRQPAGSAGAAPAIRIAAAASLKPVLPELIAAYANANPHVGFTTTYGASGNFYAQLTSDAPFDLFLSADMMYPQRLSEAGLTTSPPREYAAGRLVVWTPRASGLRAGMDTLTDPRVKKIAIANPAHAPYGRAASKALESAGVLDAVREKLVLGESVEQAATFVRTGGADIAILPKSQTVLSPMSDEGLAADVPEGVYEPIRHGGVTLKTSSNAGAAEAFLSFLTGPEAQAILARRGLAAIKD